MAWLSGLADKAENLLNKIDQNTAAALNKDKYDVSQTQLTEVTWAPPPRFCVAESTATMDIHDSTGHFPYVRSTPRSTVFAPTTVGGIKEEELLAYLNTPEVSPKKTIGDATTSPPTPSSLLAKHPADETDSVSESSIRGDRSSPGFSRRLVDVADRDHPIRSATQVQDSLLQMDVQDSGIGSNDNTIRESIKSDHNGIDKRFDVTRPQRTYELDREDVETNEFVNSSNDRKRYFEQTETGLERVARLPGKQQTDHQKEITILNEKLQHGELERIKLVKQMLDLHTSLERCRSELNSTRSELEQHRARALRTLQEKEKLISELKVDTTSGADEATILESNQLRQERDLLRVENQQTCEQLRVVREELINADLKLEKARQRSTEANVQAQEILAAERRRRFNAEEDARLHSEEARSLKDELLRNRSAFTLQLQKQQSEISRLKLQLSTSSTPSNEVETRLASLTQTLVSKQQALESLTTERNALRLQLEKIEHEIRNPAGTSRRSMSYNNMNDTDDAKAQVPTLFMETPFDTGVTRRVKRAYSSLDAISVRTGVFLRRYPLARILVLIYMALLQFWVLVVLLSQSPEAH